MGSSKQPSKVTQTNQVKLSPQQTAIANLAAPYAEQYAQQDLTLPAPVAQQFTPLELQGQQQAVAAAQGPMQQQADQAAATNSWLMNPALLSPDSNPYLAQQGNAITQTATDNLLQKILPSLRSGSMVNGGFYGGGNTRYGIAQGQAVGDTNTAISNALANLYGGAYQQGLATLGGAVDRSGSVLANLLKPATTIAGVGAQQRDLATANSAAQQQYDWMSQQLPFLKAQQLYSLVSGMPGGSGVSTVTGAQPGTSPTAGALGGAMSGAAAGSALGPWGALAGGVIGGLGGYFGSK